MAKFPIGWASATRETWVIPRMIIDTPTARNIVFRRIMLYSPTIGRIGEARRQTDCRHVHHHSLEPIITTPGYSHTSSPQKEILVTALHFHIRSFLRLSLTVFLLAGGRPTSFGDLRVQAGGTVLFKGGSVIDGTGAPAVLA